VDQRPHRAPQLGHDRRLQAQRAHIRRARSRRPRAVQLRLSPSSRLPRDCPATERRYQKPLQSQLVTRSERRDSNTSTSTLANLRQGRNCSRNSTISTTYVGAPWTCLRARTCAMSQ
jgi:hypothetical protein